MPPEVALPRISSSTEATGIPSGPNSRSSTPVAAAVAQASSPTTTATVRKDAGSAPNPECAMSATVTPEAAAKTSIDAARAESGRRGAIWYEDTAKRNPASTTPNAA